MHHIPRRWTTGAGVTEDADDDSSIMRSMGEINDNTGPGRLIVFSFIITFDLSKIFKL